MDALRLRVSTLCLRLRAGQACSQTREATFKRKRLLRATVPPARNRFDQMSLHPPNPVTGPRPPADPSSRLIIFESITCDLRL